MNCTTENIRKTLKCNKETLRAHLGNWRFNRFLTSYRPESYEVNDEFITVLKNFVELRPQQKWHKNIKYLYRLITP